MATQTSGLSEMTVEIIQETDYPEAGNQDGHWPMMRQ